MRRIFLSKKAESVFITFFFCTLGFISIWIAKNGLGLQEEAIYIAFLILPILIYMIASGRIVEFKAFGAEAKFAELAKKTIEPSLETVEGSIEDMAVVMKAGTFELQRMQKNLDTSKPIMLTLALKRTEGQYYHVKALKVYIDSLSQYRTFKGVIIINRDGKYELYFPAKVILKILEARDSGRFIDHINSSSVEKLQNYPGVITERLTRQSTNIDALDKMTLHNLDTLVVVGENSAPVGVVDREQIISSLLLAMVR